jgi:hypothetical protein
LAAAEDHRALADKHIVQESVAVVTLTAEQIHTLGRYWVEELLQVCAATTEHPGEFEALIHEQESELHRPLTEPEQRELLVNFLLDRSR